MKGIIFKKVKEYAALIAMLSLFFISPYLLRALDPTAATFDAGVLQVIIVTLIQFSIFMAVTWSVVNTIWPDLGRYFKIHFSGEFNTLSSWQRVKVSLFVYF